MATGPETRPSLILRLHDPADDAAWEEFVAIYRPVIVRLAEFKGLQRCDADDLAQQVLLSVANNIGRWEHDPQRARFRTWLAHAVRNATLNALTRMPADRGAGGTTGMLALENHAGATDDAEMLELEWRRETFRWAVDQVRDEFQPQTWEAFWITAVDGLSASEAAEKTRKSIGAVYVARSRVMQRVQAKLKELTGDVADAERLEGNS